MNLNINSLGSEMLQRKVEIEKVAVNTTSTHVQTPAVCCDCC